MNKKQARLRRAKGTRMHIRELDTTRLSVHRTPRHIYAQVLSVDGARVLATASTVEKEMREALPNGGNTAAAAEVGKRLAERALAAGIAEVAFDRSGFRYHGRIKALADAAREHGLKF
ncbi:MAG: 50S ribosomal protein L18 [Gammaproteobacteria bacterium]|nr:50S ribosomal protein L18 [Gammaproteobacteria bacterium]